MNLTKQGENNLIRKDDIYMNREFTDYTNLECGICGAKFVGRMPNEVPAKCPICVANEQLQEIVDGKIESVPETIKEEFEGSADDGEETKE